MFPGTARWPEECRQSAAARSLPAGIRGQRLYLAVGDVRGAEGRVFGPACVLSALTSLSLALLLLGEPTSSYKTKKQPQAAWCQFMYPDIFPQIRSVCLRQHLCLLLAVSLMANYCAIILQRLTPLEKLLWMKT